MIPALRNLREERGTRGVGAASKIERRGHPSEVKEVDRNGQFRLHRHRHYITKALAGKQVGLLEVEHRILVFYRRTLICELDPVRSRAMTSPQPATPAGRV